MLRQRNNPWCNFVNQIYEWTNRILRRKKPSKNASHNVMIKFPCFWMFKFRQKKIGDDIFIKYGGERIIIVIAIGELGLSVKTENFP